MLTPVDDVKMAVAVTLKFVGSIETLAIPSVTKSLLEKGHVSLNPPFIGIGMLVTKDALKSANSPFFGGKEVIVTVAVDNNGVKLMFMAGVTVSPSEIPTYELQTGALMGIAALGFFTLLSTML